MRNKRLDILRAVAVLLVLGRHGTGPAVWRDIGWVGVDLFFVLSGFLISGLLYTEYKNTGGIRWGRFFVRRGFKIYPSFYVMLIATLAWALLDHRPIRWRPFLPEVFFFQSYDYDRAWPHTWSLAVEEHFYLFLPFVLFIMISFQRKKPNPNPFKAIPMLCLLISIACLLQRFRYAYSLPQNHGWWQQIVFPTHLRIDSLFFGVFLAYLYHFHASFLTRVLKTRWLGILLVSGLLISSCCFFPIEESPFMLSFGLTALYLGFGALLILLLYQHSEERKEPVTGWKRRFNVGIVLAYIGTYSYSIYLWHLMVIQHYEGFLRLFGINVTESNRFWWYVLLSLAAGIILSKLIEYPALHLRNRLFPSPNLVGPSLRHSFFVTNQESSMNQCRQQRL